MDYKSIKVKCRNCGKEYPADQFVLDHVYKMMVCPQCVKDRQKKEYALKSKTGQAEEEPEQKKPSGWDKEDEYIEKAYKEKQSRQSNSPVFEEIDRDKIKYKCSKCGYKFVYNRLSKTPSKCPYCMTEVYSFSI
jgi:DNA-directed RNA polymerase subunit RPC12/RpoP